MVRFTQLWNRLNIMAIWALVVLSMPLAGCDKDEPEIFPPDPDHFDNVVLVYAASANDLYNNIVSDKSEMLQGLEAADMPFSRLMVYETVPACEGENGRSAVLYEAKKTLKGEYVFAEVKTYPASTFSTDPKRLTEVILDVKELRKADSYGLVFWSHGGSWDPAFSDHQHPKVPGISGETGIMPDEDIPGDARWWGSDEVDTPDGNRIKDKMDIDELAAAIPDACFDFIWFDSCYMSGIETAYQLRHKARYFAAYPTEVYSPGMDYSSAIPALIKPEADLVAAAKALYDYYTFRYPFSPAAVTVGVFDLGVIEEVAAIARQAYSGFVMPDSRGLQKYTRGGIPAFDFRQYMLAAAAASGNVLDLKMVEDVFNRFTICKYASDYDFNNRMIVPENFSGISTHVYNPENNEASEGFYRSLDWFRAAYGS